MVGISDELADCVKGVVNGLLAKTSTPGASVALIVDGDLVLTIGLGFRDIERSIPIHSDARFYLYSITKTLVATAVLRLVEEGRLALDDAIQTILPDSPIEPPLTIRQLLNHTSGLPDYSTLPAYFEDLRANPGTPWSVEQFFRNTLSQGYLFPAGSGWAYSNIGYLALKLAVERLTGETLSHALRELLFEPLGLQRTFVATSLDHAGVLTPGYSSQLDTGSSERDVTQHYHPGWVSHGVVVSTAAETAGILEALVSRRLLGPELGSATHDGVPVPATHPHMRKPGYGLGLMLDLDSPFGQVAGHAGGGPGYSTAAFHFPDVVGQRVTAVALANRDDGDVATSIVFALGDELKLMALATS